MNYSYLLSEPAPIHAVLHCVVVHHDISVQQYHVLKHLNCLFMCTCILYRNWINTPGRTTSVSLPSLTSPELSNCPHYSTTTTESISTDNVTEASVPNDDGILQLYTDNVRGKLYYHNHNICIVILVKHLM